MKPKFNWSKIIQRLSLIHLDLITGCTILFCFFYFFAKKNQRLVIIWVIGRMSTEITSQQEEQTNADTANKDGGCIDEQGYEYAI